MNASPDQKTNAVQRPGLFACLKTGFDTIANHIGIVLLPLGLDFLLWMGPHLRLKSLLEQSLKTLELTMQEQGALSPEVLEGNRQVWLLFADRFNLLSLLRTVPVGIPSLMVNRSPIATPLGAPVFFDLNDFLSISLFSLLAITIGLSVSALYYLVVAQLSAQSTLDWRLILSEWPRALLRSFGLMVMLFVILLVITIPFSCLLGILAISGVMFSQIGIFLYGIILAWWIFPLVFSAHGYFLYHEKLWHSIRRSIRLTRQTFPITALLLMVVLLTSEVLDVLWNTPNENSWLMVLGIIGHAFINTALLASTFVYYGEINRWLQSQQRVSVA